MHAAGMLIDHFKATSDAKMDAVRITDVKTDGHGETSVITSEAFTESYNFRSDDTGTF